MRDKTIVFQLIVISILIVTFIAGCKVDQNNQKYNILIGIEGKVYLKRSQWKSGEFVSTNFGTIVGNEDLLKVDQSGKADVLCSDGTLQSFHFTGMPVSIGSKCKIFSPSIFQRSNINVGVPRNSQSATTPTPYPYIIEPRGNFILNKTPILRWGEVPGTTEYSIQVSLCGKNQEIWRTSTINTKVIYSGPALSENTCYILTVIADNGISSEEEDAINLGFKTLTKERAQSIIDDANIIKKSLKPVGGDAYAIARFYANNELISEAIDLLETEINPSDSDPAVLRTLGQLYLQVGLNHEAEEYYSKSIVQLLKVDDPEALALSKLGLGHTLIDLGRYDEASPYLHDSLQFFDAVSDHEYITCVDNLLNGHAGCKKELLSR